MVSHLKVNKFHNKSCHKKIWDSTTKNNFLKLPFDAFHHNTMYTLIWTLQQSYNTTLQICNRKSLLYEEQCCWSLYQGYRNPVIWIFVWWHVTFTGARQRTCYMSFDCSLQLSSCMYIYRKFVGTSIMNCYLLHLLHITHDLFLLPTSIVQ